MGLSPLVASMVFLESPWPILIIGIVLEAVLAVALVKSGRGVLLLPMGIVALVVVAGVIIERIVVTEKERVEQTLDEAAAAIEADNLDRLLACISPSPDAEKPRQDARHNHDLFRVTQVSIRNLHVEINKFTSPPTAEAQFSALVTGSLKSGEFGEVTRWAGLKVSLRQESGRWLIFDYKYTLDPREM